MAYVVIITLALLSAVALRPTSARSCTPTQEAQAMSAHALFTQCLTEIGDRLLRDEDRLFCFCGLLESIGEPPFCDSAKAAIDGITESLARQGINDPTCDGISRIPPPNLDSVPAVPSAVDLSGLYLCPAPERTAFVGCASAYDRCLSRAGVRPGGEHLLTPNEYVALVRCHCSFSDCSIASRCQAIKEQLQSLEPPFPGGVSCANFDVIIDYLNVPTFLDELASAKNQLEVVNFTSVAPELVGQTAECQASLEQCRFGLQQCTGLEDPLGQEPMDPEKTACFCTFLQCVRAGPAPCKGSSSALEKQVLNKVAGIGYCPSQTLPDTSRFGSSAVSHRSGRAGSSGLLLRAFLLAAAARSMLALLVPNAANALHDNM